MILNKFKIVILLAFSLFVYSTNTFAQTQEVIVIDSTHTKPNKWKFGMGFGLNFVGGTNINLAPNLYYNVSDKITFGAGLQYNYSSIKDLRTTSTIGGTLISLYNPSKRITTLLEFAQLNVSSKMETPSGEIKDSFWESALFVGAGLNITNKISVGAKYNLLYKEDESVYTSPVIPFVNISF